MTLDEGRMVYWSRSRQEMWRKGDTSGDHQVVREAFYDCDADVLLFKVDQQGNGACHTGDHSCFYRPFGRCRSCASGPPATSSARSPPRTPSCRSGPSCWPTWRRRWPPTPSSSATGRASSSSRSSTASAGAASRSSGATRRPRSSCATAQVEVHGTLPVDVPTDQGHPRRARAPARRRTGPRHPRAAAAARRVDGLPRLRRHPRGRAAARRAARRPPRARRGDEHDRLAGRVRPLAPAGHLIESVPVARPRRRPARRRLRRGDRRA